MAKEVRPSASNTSNDSEDSCAFEEGVTVIGYVLLRPAEFDDPAYAIYVLVPVPVMRISQRVSQNAIIRTRVASQNVLCS